MYDWPPPQCSMHDVYYIMACDGCGVLFSIRIIIIIIIITFVYLAE